jgi:hypothetical protein
MYWGKSLGRVLIWVYFYGLFDLALIFEGSVPAVRRLSGAVSINGGVWSEGILGRNSGKS